MPATRHFLGYDRPALWAAADYLVGRGAADAPGGGADLSGVTVVVPGGRAGRRLEQALVARWEAAHHGPLAPPRIVTVGRLPEQLYDAGDTLGDTAAAWALAAALRDADPADIALALGQPPADDDAPGWVRVATELAAVVNELRGGCVEPEAAAAHTGDERWAAIARLDQRYRRLLAEHGRTDRALARLDALAQQRCRAEADLVLLGIAELPTITRRMLGQVADRVTALLVAADDEAELFDGLGLLRADAWAQRRLAVADQRVVVADRPADQALAVLRVIQTQAAAQELSADDITIGVGDPALPPVIARRLASADIAARLPPGMRLADTRPALLLAAAGAFLASRRLDDLAALARHPDLEADPAAAEDWATLLDRYLTDHVQSRLTTRWLGRQAPALKAAFDRAAALLPAEPETRRPVTRWAPAILALLDGVYGRRDLDRHAPGDALELGALTALAEALHGWSQLDADSPLTPVANAAQAIALLLAAAGDEPIADEPDRAAVEVLGHLELLLDDAPLAIVAGVNEGMIPASRSADPLLPDSLRVELGLEDNRRRYCRDLHLLHAVTRSRPTTTLITGRRAAAGDPLLPSRLLLACDEPTMVARINAFYDERPAPVAPPLIRPGRSDDLGLLIPPPPAGPLPEPIESLSVTAFRAYLACPYRFYLRYVLGLEALDDEAVEMSGSVFGGLAHRVLDAFGASDLAAATDRATLAAYFADRLKAEAQQTFGDLPTAAVALQLQQLEERLAAFAGAQAAAAAEGWRIMPQHVEQRREATLDVDGQAFTVVGKIDRIDQHPEHGYRIIDYKTGDTGSTPGKSHRDSSGWIDLQLPLYRELAAAAGIDGPVALGYALLPRKLTDVGFAWADWSAAQVDEAVDAARDIVRSIRAGVFWPPGKPPEWDDGLAAVCLDASPGRGAIIAASAPHAPTREGGSDA